MIMSKELTSQDFKNWQYRKAKVFNKEYLRQNEGNFKGYPYRTFAGGKYAGGYSDHFPVYLFMLKEFQKTNH